LTLSEKAAINRINSEAQSGVWPLRSQKLRIMGKGSLSETKVEPRLPDELREVMTVDQAAQYLGVSPDTLYKYLSEGKVPAFKLGNRWRLKKTTLDRWMERQSQTRDGKTARRANEARPQ